MKIPLFLFISIYLLISGNSYADKSSCLEQCDGIFKNCVSKCINPHPTYQSCKEACNANKFLCIDQCSAFDKTQKKLQEMDKPSSN